MHEVRSAVQEASHTMFQQPFDPPTSQPIRGLAKQEVERRIVVTAVCRRCRLERPWGEVDRTARFVYDRDHDIHQTEPMNRILHIVLLCALSAAATAQSFNPTLNASDPKEFGEPVKAELITADMEAAKTPAVPVEISVLLKKPIVMGCQYIYRVTNRSADQTVKLSMYAVPDQKYEEKIKPGETIELLANTMIRCGATKEEKKERGCIDCQPSLNITEIEVK